MNRRCPECGGIRTGVSPADEMTSGRAEYLCSECQLWFTFDAAKGLREADE